jgi:hypothetical protein
MTEISVFDEMVDELLDGEPLVAEFDSGITIIVTNDMVSISHSDSEEDDLIELNLDGDEIEYLHLFLEARFTAEKNIKNINWDDLLSGNL